MATTKRIRAADAAKRLAELKQRTATKVQGRRAAQVAAAAKKRKENKEAEEEEKKRASPATTKERKKPAPLASKAKKASASKAKKASPSTTITVTLESKTRLERLRQETISGQCDKGCWNFS